MQTKVSNVIVILTEILIFQGMQLQDRDVVQKKNLLL